MERNFGAVLEVGYFNFTLDTGEVESEAAVDQAYDFVTSGTSIYGSFGMPACPGHAPAFMRINALKIVGVVELP